MKTKICTKCKKRKFLSAFYKNSTSKDGIRGDCKICVGIYARTRKVERSELGKKYRKTIAGCLRARFISMKQRCNNPKNRAYKHYGGRGIKCLFESSNEFIDYIVNELHIDPRGFDIDRINNDGNYEPGNIRFVTAAINNKNRKRKDKDE